MGLSVLGAAAATVSSQSTSTETVSIVNSGASNQLVDQFAAPAITFTSLQTGSILPSSIPSGVNAFIPNADRTNYTVGTFVRITSGTDAFVGYGTVATIGADDSAAGLAGGTTGNAILRINATQILTARTSTAAITTLTIREVSHQGFNHRPAADYDVSSSLTAIFAGSEITTAINGDGFAVGDDVEISAVPSTQFAGVGTIDAVDAMTGSITFTIDSVTTARGSADFTDFTLNRINPGGIRSVGSTTVPAGMGGFVQAAYFGNELLSNAQERDLTIRFGTAPNITEIPFRPGAVIPTGAELINNGDDEFNILINA